MTGWPESTVPCAGNPDRWEAPAAVASSRVGLDAAYRDVLRAVEQCRSCPALDPCARWAVLHPPQHTVQGGMVYGHDRKPRRPWRWRETVIARPGWRKRKKEAAA